MLSVRLEHLVEQRLRLLEVRLCRRVAQERVQRRSHRPLGNPSDAAQLIALLCSDDAAWVTGQVIDADGGFSL